MKSRLALLLMVVAVLLLTASSAGAPAPRVWVLDNLDPDFTTPPFDDSLTLLDDAGNIVMRTGPFNTCAAIGGWRIITASPAEQVCWVVELSNGKLDKVDRDGNVLLTLGGRMFLAVDVDRQGNVYGAVQGTYHFWLYKLDPDGYAVDSVTYGGIDLVVDEARSAIWVVGNDINLVNKDLQHQFTIDPIDWYAVGVDFASDGTAWIVERLYSAGLGRDGLLHVARDGQILESVDLPFSPFCVRVDRTTGIVWMTGILGAQGLYQYDPEEEELVKVAGFRGYSLAIDHANNQIWCATHTDVRAYSKDGDWKFTNSAFGHYTNKWITIGALPVHVDIKPGSCPNPLRAGEASPVLARLRPENPVPRRGVLPLAILGTDDFDVTQIDPSSIKLEGVSPLRWAYEDVSTPVYEPTEECECTDLGADGYTDLTLKFDKSAIINALGELSAGDEVVLIVTGELYDGTRIEGSDCIVIVGGGDGGDAVADRVGNHQLPSGFALYQNHPNPFNAATEISFSLPEASDVRLEVYNIIGEKVTTLVNGQLEAGKHTATWDSADCPSGIYLYCLRAGELSETRKMLLLK